MKLGRGEYKPVKKQKRVLMFAKLNAGKGSPDDYHAIEKAKSKKTEEMELA